MIRLVSEPISVDRLLSEVEDESTGGVVVFLGRVRNESEGRAVTRMAYEAFAPMAESEMRKIAQEVEGRWPVKKMAMVHRTGELALGEVSVAIAVCCAHREEAFEACKYAIDELKRRVPIWKKEFFEAGSAWVTGTTPQVPEASAEGRPASEHPKGTDEGGK